MKIYWLVVCSVNVIMLCHLSFVFLYKWWQKINWPNLGTKCQASLSNIKCITSSIPPPKYNLILSTTLAAAPAENLEDIGDV